MINRLKHLFDHEPVPSLRSDLISKTILGEQLETLAHLVRITARRGSFGLFIHGAAGLGKTQTVLRTLAQEHIRPEILNSHCTPLSLYEKLSVNPDATFVLDDCDTLYGNLASLGILRSALWASYQGKRTVTYNSTQSSLPQSFTFDGRIIFIANKIPRNNTAFEALLGRVDVFELRATNDDVLNAMRHLAVEGFESLTARECLEIVEFLADYRGTRPLSLRLLEPSYRKAIYAKLAAVDWRSLVRTQLDQLGKGETECVLVDDAGSARTAFDHALEAYPDSVKDQLDMWCRTTGLSRASFFRLKKRLGFDNREPPSSNPGR